MLNRINRALLAVILQIVILVLVIRFGIPWAMNEMMKSTQDAITAIRTSPSVRPTQAK